MKASILSLTFKLIVHHNFDKLFIVNKSISVDVCSIDERHHLLLSQRVPYVRHQVLELCRLYGPIPILVEGPEGQPHLGVASLSVSAATHRLLVLVGADTLYHHQTKLGELNAARVVHVILKR